MVSPGVSGGCRHQRSTLHSRCAERVRRDRLRTHGLLLREQFHFRLWHLVARPPYQAFAAAKIYFELNCVSGPLYARVGVARGRNRHLSIVPVVGLGLAFVHEALVRAPQSPIFYGYGGKVATIEAVAGALWIAFAFYWTLALRRRDSPRRRRSIRRKP